MTIHNGRLPNFIGIGAQKSGTTWIFDCLREHPTVCGPDKKEVGFFMKTRANFFGLPDGAKKVGARPWEQGLQVYKKYFISCDEDKLLGEFTPGYLYYPESPKLIKEFCPNAKLIVCLRNPIDRAYSHYLHEKNRLGFSQTFEQAITQEPEFVERGKYAEQLERYFALFPKEQILVTIYEDIAHDPVAFIQKIYRFLGVDDTFVPKLAMTRSNVRKDNLSRLGSFMQKKGAPILQKFSWGRRLKKTSFARNIFQILGRKKSVQSMSQETREKLQKLFADDIKNLEHLLGKELVTWRK